MRMRSQLALAVFAAGSLGVAALVADRYIAASEILYGRVEERAGALLETVENLAMPQLLQGDGRDINREIGVLGRLPRVESISIYDENGKVVFQTEHKDEPRAPRAGPAKARLIELHKAMTDPVSGKLIGGVQVALSTESLQAALRDLLWRGIGLGVALLLTMAVTAWYLGVLLGRRMESIARAIEGVELDKPLGLKDGGSDSEADLLVRKFNALHERLLLEIAERKKLTEVKDDLTNMLIHDMKQPLTILNTVLAMFAESGGAELPQGKRLALLRMAKRSIRRESSMIEDLLQMARLKNAEIPLRKERLSLKSFVEECARENGVVVEQAQRRWTLEVGDGIDSSWIYGDRALLKRLVGNLVLNAIDHTPEETGITLGARLHVADRSKVEIYVRDEGLGVPPAQREAIFEKFRTSSQFSRNAGLGLAFCRMAAERHSARLEVLDRPEPGATFALIIPFASSQSLALERNGAVGKNKNTTARETLQER